MNEQANETKQETARHTPGPWKVDYDWATRHSHPSQGPHIVGADDRSVLELYPAYERSEEGEANAALIAAAPELLEALQHASMSEHHPACECKGEKSAFPERYCHCHVWKARAAIAKARTVA